MFDMFPKDHRDRGVESLNLPPEAPTFPDTVISACPEATLKWPLGLPICFSPSVLQSQIYLLQFLVSDTHGALHSTSRISAVVAEQ